MAGDDADHEDAGTAVDRAAVGIMAAGVALAVLLMAAGLVAAAVGEGAVRPDDLGPGSLLSGLGRGEPPALVALGVVVLLVTPLVRLAVLVVGFGRGREWLFVAITALVLVELAVSALLVAAR